MRAGTCTPSRPHRSAVSQSRVQQQRRTVARRDRVRTTARSRRFRRASIRAGAAGSARMPPAQARSMPSSSALASGMERRRDQISIRKSQRSDDRRIGRGHRQCASSSISTQRSGWSSRACAMPEYSVDDPRIEHDAFFRIRPRHRDQRLAPNGPRCRFLRRARGATRSNGVSPGSLLPPGNSQ